MTHGPFRAPGLVATDLDGTLLRGDESLSPRTRAALEKAVAAGAVHVIVTGRSVQTAGPVFDDLRYDGLAVCGQGAQLYDAGAHELIAAHTIDIQFLFPLWHGGELRTLGLGLALDGRWRDRLRRRGRCALERRDVLDRLLVRSNGRFLSRRLRRGLPRRLSSLCLPLCGLGRAEELRERALTHARAPSRH